jgi:tripartite-type tricarboxylate transporter receptor subunit TctC
MKSSKLWILLLAVFIGFSFPATGLAKFPEKPVTYVICFNPGGESDITARIQQQALEKALGVPIVIVYKKGGGGAVGWSELTRTKPDGYTIFGTNLPHIIVQPLTRKNAGYQTGQIDNVYFFEFTPNILAVKKDSEIKTVKDLVAYAKKHPGVGIGGSGQPSANSLGTARFAQLTGTKLTYISFTGSGAAVPALLGGHVKALMTYTTMACANPDKVRALAVAGVKRATELPNVPTFKELGYDYVEGAYRGVGVPPGTPEPVRKVLQEAFAKVNQDPTVIKKMENLGFIMEDYDEAKSKKLVENLTVYYKGLLQDLGLLKK